MIEDEGVVASAIEVLEIAEIAPLLADDGRAWFTAGERAYAQAKSDPERRLAARLAAKRALLRLLGADLDPSEIEVMRHPWGPPHLRLGARAAARLHALGARRAVVSLTHERRHAAAAVLLLRGEE